MEWRLSKWDRRLFAVINVSQLSLLLLSIRHHKRKGANGLFEMKHWHFIEMNYRFPPTFLCGYPGGLGGGAEGGGLMQSIIEISDSSISQYCGDQVNLGANLSWSLLRDFRWQTQKNVFAYKCLWNLLSTPTHLFQASLTFVFEEFAYRCLHDNVCECIWELTPDIFIHLLLFWRLCRTEDKTITLMQFYPDSVVAVWGVYWARSVYGLSWGVY